MRIRQLQHCVYQTEYHLVWGTRYRRKYLKDYVRGQFVRSLYAAQKKYPDWYFVKINTGDDHVHILMEIPPKYAISEVVQKLKTVASIYLKRKFKFIDRMYEGGGIWATGYFVSTVGLNEEMIRKYIERQNQYDTGFDVAGELS